MNSSSEIATIQYVYLARGTQGYTQTPGGYANDAPTHPHPDQYEKSDELGIIGFRCCQGRTCAEDLGSVRVYAT